MKKNIKCVFLALVCMLSFMGCEYHEPNQRELARIQKQWLFDFIDGYTYMFDIGVTSPGECIRTIRRADGLFHEKDRYAFHFQMRKDGNGGKLTGTGIGDAEEPEITLEFSNLKDKSVTISYLYGGVLPVVGSAYTTDTLIIIHP